MKSSRRVVLILAVALLVIGNVLAGCAQKEEAAQSQSKEEPKRSVQSEPAEKVLRIGFIGPLTGDVKTFGESTRNGFVLSLEQAGMKAGDYTIQHIMMDDRNDVTEAVNVATKLISQDKVQAIVGSVTSKCTIPVSEIANSAKVVQITGTSTNQKVTVDGGKRKEFIFRACYIDPFQGKVGAIFALDKLKAKTAAVIFDQANDYTKGLAEVFKENFEAGGGKVIAYEAYQQTDVDFSAAVTAIAKKDPDVVYLPDYYQKVSLIAKQARDKGVKSAFVGADGWDSPELDFATMEGGYHTNHYSPDDPRPEVQRWVQQYKEKYNAVPDALATLCYDATNLLLNAVNTCNSNDPVKIKDALQSTKDFATVSGKITFDANGDPVKSVAILQIKGGKQSFVTTVTP